MTTRSATRRKPTIVNHLPQMLICPTTPDDIVPITAIYRHHVLHGNGSFEIDPPGADEMARRWRAVTEQGMPHLVLRDAQTVWGYAYAQPFRPRQAYRHTLEDSIYLHPEAVPRAGAGPAGRVDRPRRALGGAPDGGGDR